MRPHHANHTLRALLLALLLTGATAGRPLLQADPPAAGDTDAPEAAPQLTVAPKVLGDPIPSSADGFVAALMKDGHATCGGALIAPNVSPAAARRLRMVSPAGCRRVLDPATISLTPPPAPLPAPRRSSSPPHVSV